MAKIQFKVRIVHTGKEVTISMEGNKTGAELLRQLLRQPGLNLTKVDGEGNPVLYKLASKATGQVVDKKSLDEAGVKTGDTLILTQELIAG